METKGGVDKSKNKGKWAKKMQNFSFSFQINKKGSNYLQQWRLRLRLAAKIYIFTYMFAW